MTSNSTLPLYHNCPPGVGGPACLNAACGSPFTAPASRPLKSTNATTCPASSCANGFGGLNCNICQNDNACRASPGNSANVCHQSPRPVSTTYMQCDIDMPTLKTFYPNKAITLTIDKVVTPDNTSATGLAPWGGSGAQAGTALSQVWLDGVMQYYCQASNCTSTNSTTSIASGGTTGSDVWTCTDLKCYCPPDTAMCSGAGGGIAMDTIINSLSGSLSMPCDYSASGKAQCQFKGGQLTTLLGPAGLPLDNCSFGSCVTKDEVDAFWLQSASQTAESKQQGDTLSGAVIGGVSVLCIVVALLLSLLLCGWLQRRRAQRRPRAHDEAGAIGIEWKDVDYRVEKGNKTPKWLITGRARKQEAPTGSGDAAAAAETPQTEKDVNEAAALAECASSSGLILHSVTGTAPPGQLVAILGPSGAGKSTLVELLAGKEKRGNLKGSIRLVGADGGDTANLTAASSSRRLLAFVDQEDQLPSHSTVREALLFAAHLSLPENVGEDEKRGIVQSTITTLGLGAVADSIIGDRGQRGISGGEKRRVSIGIALVGRPRILVLDEPLSGLDAYNAVRVMTALRALASGGQSSANPTSPTSPTAASSATTMAATTVILTLHQPSSQMFHMLDRAILLSGGRILYDGPPGEAMSWCEEVRDHPCPAGHNVADHLLEIAMRERTTGESGSSSPPNDKHDGSASTNSSALLVSHTTTTTWFTQVHALTQRYLSTAKRDMTGPLAHLMGHIVLALMVGGSFFHVSKTISGFQNRIGSLYFLFMLMLFASLSSMTLLARVRPLMTRERSDGLYTPWAFLLAHGVYDVVFLRLVPGFFLSTILYWMVGLKPSAAYYFEYLLIAEIFYLVVTLYMMLQAALFPDLSIAILGGAAYILLNIGYGGFLLSLDTIPPVLRWMQWFAPLKYALEACTQHEIKGLEVKDVLGGVPVNISASLIAPELFTLTGSYYRDLLVLALGFAVGHSLVLAAAVWWRMRDRR